MSLSIMGNWGEERDMDYLMDLPDPVPLGNRHHPERLEVPFQIMEMVLETKGLIAKDVVHRVSADNAKCLTTFNISENGASNRFESTDHSISGFTIAAQDSSMANNMGWGSSVFLCTNMIFNANYMMRHKSTLNGRTNLRNMAFDAIHDLDNVREQIGHSFNRMKKCPMTDEQAAWWLIDAVGKNAINTRDIPKLWSSYLEPEIKEFKTGNFYSLYNSVTGMYQERNPFNISRLSRNLNKASDTYLDMREGREQIHELAIRN